MAVVVIAVILALPQPVAVPEPVSQMPPDEAERGQRRRAAEELGDQLLARRIALDARRGTLDGNSAIDEALTSLEARLRDGDISEDEFEAEKVRLLGG